MDHLLADLRYTLRQLRRSAVFTVISVSTLALGIGANTALFGIVDAVLLRPLPYTDPDRVVMVWEDSSFAGFPKNTPAPGNVAEWRRLNHSFADIAWTRGATASLTVEGPPEQVVGRGVSPNFLAVLGVPPQLGRSITEDEDRSGAQVVMISHRLWQRRYSGDPRVIGRTMTMNDAKYEIVAVLPPAFVFRTRESDYWVPISLSPAAAAERRSHYLQAFARLKPGVTLDTARADMDAVARTLQQQYPDTNRGVGAVVTPMKEDLLGNTSLELIVLMAAAGAILLIACANLGALLLTRAADRQSELAIRSALGATRIRLIRQIVLEGLMLAIVGGALGLVLPPIALRVLTSLVPAGVLPAAVAIDWRMLTFSFAVSIAVGLLFSSAAAVQVAWAPMRGALQQTRGSVGPANRTMRNLLVVLQIAAAIVLLVSAGLMLKTIANLRAIDVGFRLDNLLTLRTSLPRPRYGESVKRLDFYDRVIAGVRALPGVESAAYGSTLPFQSQGNTRFFGIEGQPPKPGEVPDALYRVGTGDYLKTLGVQLTEGSLFDDRDGRDAPRVVVVNETLAKHFVAQSSAIGQQLRFGPPGLPLYMIVGVVKDVHERGYELAMKPGVYVPTHQMPDAVSDFLIVRTRGDATSLGAAVQRIIARVDPSQPITDVKTMDAIVDLTVADRRQQTILLVAFSVLALLLAAIGLYGMLAYAVAGSRREIGLRMALGATRQRVMTMIVVRGLGLTGAGITMGAAAGWAVTRVMSRLLYGVGSTDAGTFAAVITLLVVVASTACAIPAARASRVDPMTVLRDQ
jgi:putative ABC transport system permease protein